MNSLIIQTKVNYIHMHKVHEQRKKQLISSFVMVLQQLELNNTANVLVEQSGLHKDKDVELDIVEILKDRTVNERERRNAVENYCKYSIQNYMREGKIDEALQIYEVIVPLHCPQKIEPFSLLFAENYQNDHKGLHILLQNFFERPNVLPQCRVGLANFGNEIWFMHFLGASILLIDCDSNALIVAGSQVRHRKDKIHADKVTTVSIAPASTFCTGGRDRLAKIWDKELVLLHTIDMHRAKINTVLFFQQNLIIFDHDAVISLHSLEGKQGLERKSVFKTNAPFLDSKYSKNKKKIYGVTFERGCGHVNIVNIEKRRVEKMILAQKRIYAIQISLDQKMIFANVAPCEIHAYSLTPKHNLLYKLTGFIQQKNLMRMSQGGKDGKYMAVTSEQGTVRIYNIKEEDQVLKLLGQSKKSINCVTWKNQEIYFACDAGNLQCWGCRGTQKYHQNGNSKDSNGKKQKNGWNSFSK